MAHGRLRRVFVTLILAFVLVLLAGCGLVMRAWRLTERPEGPCLGDAPAFESTDGPYADSVRGQELTREWSWKHFGWKCVRTYFPSGKTETVYVR